VRVQRRYVEEGSLAVTVNSGTSYSRKNKANAFEQPSVIKTKI
jgi:hypothetical protein